MNSLVVVFFVFISTLSFFSLSSLVQNKPQQANAERGGAQLVDGPWRGLERHVWLAVQANH